MMDPIQNNSIAVRGANEAFVPSAKRSIQSPDLGSLQDTAEISAHSREFEGYMQTLRNEPDVRPDKVENARNLLNAKVPYPPLDVVNGISKLIGLGL